uniref:BOI-related E3 ubiquitin-protein ligase 3 n=1 Tax=Oryza barthii TaxID=65489 RepID=A0A0D3FM74_9ORYZ
MAVDAHHLHRLPPPIQPAESMFSPRQPCFGAAAGEVVVGGAGGAVMAGLCQEEQLVQGYRQVFHHAAKMWAELAEQRRRHARQMVATVEAAAARRLRAKDEEIERIGRLNWALEERLKGMYVEAQVWRDLAQSNEATANALRGELEHVLDAHARRGADHGDGDDAESCCY